MVSAVLVMLMTPGVRLAYGGLVRKMNFISMIALSFVSFTLESAPWVLFGYSLVFGPDDRQEVVKRSWKHHSDRPGSPRYLADSNRLCLIGPEYFISTAGTS